jgi:hypothetical protein
MCKADVGRGTGREIVRDDHLARIIENTVLDIVSRIGLAKRAKAAEDNI